MQARGRWTLAAFEGGSDGGRGRWRWLQLNATLPCQAVPSQEFTQQARRGQTRPPLSFPLDCTWHRQCQAPSFCSRSASRSLVRRTASARVAGFVGSTRERDRCIPTPTAPPCPLPLRVLVLLTVARASDPVARASDPAEVEACGGLNPAEVAGRSGCGGSFIESCTIFLSRAASDGESNPGALMLVKAGAEGGRGSGRTDRESAMTSS